MRPWPFTRSKTQDEATTGGYPATFRWAGVSLALSGVALGAKAWFDFSAGEPPSSGIDLIAWAAAEKFSLSMSNELMIAAAVLLIPGVIGLYASLEGHNLMLAKAGCGILAAVIPLMMVASVFQGRLVFPVYGIEADNPTTAQLVAGLFFGTEHALLLILGIPTILLSLAMRGTAFGRPGVYLGLAAGLADFRWVVTCISQQDLTWAPLDRGGRDDQAARGGLVHHHWHVSGQIIASGRRLVLGGNR